MLWDCNVGSVVGGLVRVELFVGPAGGKDVSVNPIFP